MKNRFIIGLKSSTAEQNQKMIKFIEDNHMAWWHWLGDFWLLVDSEGKLSASTISNKIEEIYPGVHHLVVLLGEDNDNWYGFGPAGGEEGQKNMFKWLHNYWSK